MPFNCFCASSYLVTTLYATLGDDAIQHGLNETEVKYIISSHDLLPKFKNILSKTPNVQTVIYFQDQLVKTNTSGLKEDVKFISYSEVIELGRTSSINGKQKVNIAFDEIYIC